MAAKWSVVNKTFVNLPLNERGPPVAGGPRWRSDRAFAMMVLCCWVTMNST
jgi:hypothetical protein